MSLSFFKKISLSSLTVRRGPGRVRVECTSGDQREPCKADEIPWAALSFRQQALLGNFSTIRKHHCKTNTRETNLFQFPKRAGRSSRAEKFDRSRASSPAVEIINSYCPIFLHIFLHQFHHDPRDWCQVIGINSTLLPDYTAIDPSYRALLGWIAFGDGSEMNEPILMSPLRFTRILEQSRDV